MRLSEKLSRLRPMSGGSPASQATVPTPSASAEGKQERLSRLRAMMGDVVTRERRRSAHRPIREPQPLPIGDVQDGPQGPYHRLRIELSPDHHHGRAPVAAALKVQTELISTLALDPALSNVDLSGMLMLDTETTGLSGGAGTVPFLIGISYFVDGALCVEQLFLRNLGEEAPLLAALAERIAVATCVVSYNGKTFDWPLLRSRFILNRMPAPPLPPHLDLLHCARRLWKGRMEAVRLIDVEQQMLGFYREDDVDGSEIPELYMSYLRGGDPTPMVTVLKHNELDVIALPAMLGVMGKSLNETQINGDARDHLAFARVAARAKDNIRAAHYALAAATSAEDTNTQLQALQLSSTMARRAGKIEQALTHLVQALPLAPSAMIFSELHLSLAKLHEHHTRNLVAALEHAQHTEAAEGQEAHRRRCERLCRRLEHRT